MDAQNKLMRENILSRLERLEAVEDIRSLVSGYAESCDQQDLVALEKLFTLEAEFDSPNGSLKSKGRENIIDMYQEVFMSRGPSFHWTHDVTIKVDESNANFASGTVYSHAETTRDGVASLAAMRYDDLYSKEEGSWKFSKRTINFFYYVKTEDYLESLSNPLRVSMGGKKIPADIPESIPAWIEFQKNIKVIKNSSNSEEMISLVKRALDHYKNKTTDQAEDVMSNSIEAYVDPERYEKEVEKIYKNLPLALCLSSEISNPNSHRAMKVIDTPVLITRGKDMKARAFLNVCRHRGSQVCEEGKGEKRNFICPYHAWTYNHEGQLVGMYGEKTFGEIDKEDFGLIELNCSERAGLIWVMLTPGVDFNIDDWLGDFALELETLNLKDWHIFDQRELEGPGWKVALDGYLEAYHHNQLHGETVGKHTVGNLLVLDTYGPHQRLTFGRKSLSDLVQKPEEEWNAPLDNIRLIHSGFPNLSISGVLGGHCLVSQIFPTSSPEITITRQTILSATEPKSDEDLKTTQDFSDMVLQAVVDEDYKMGLQIQSNISKLESYNFVYGRNEPAVQNYHNWIKEFMDKEGSNW